MMPEEKNFEVWRKINDPSGHLVWRKLDVGPIKDYEYIEKASLETCVEISKIQAITKLNHDLKESIDDLARTIRDKVVIPSRVW